MKIMCLFGARKTGAPLTPSIELMVAWDEYCVDGYPEGYEEDCKKAVVSWGDDLLLSREVTIEIDESKLNALFSPAVLRGEITS